MAIFEGKDVLDRGMAIRCESTNGGANDQVQFGGGWNSFHDLLSNFDSQTHAVIPCFNHNDGIEFTDQFFTNGSVQFLEI